eukprot:scaffold4391_cov106-Skeletonema_dohrnii-CCMP3373.AAC.2
MSATQPPAKSKIDLVIAQCQRSANVTFLCASCDIPDAHGSDTTRNARASPTLTAPEFKVVKVPPNPNRHGATKGYLRLIWYKFSSKRHQKSPKWYQDCPIGYEL